VDCVPQVGSEAVQHALFDLEQIEVLKGPQGSLMVATAIGGAVIINTRSPTDHCQLR